MAKKKKAKSDSADPTVEESMEELQQIVEALESGQDSLDVSLQKFERGMTLLRSCHKQLETAAARIEILTGVDESGSITTAPFDGSATHATEKASAADDDDSTLF